MAPVGDGNFSKSEMQPNKVVISLDKSEILEVHNGSERYGITADGLLAPVSNQMKLTYRGG